MDRTKASKLLEIYGRPTLVNKETGKSLVFARQNNKDVKEIEKMDDSTLVQRWKNLVWMNYIYGQSSLNDLQRIQLIELEMNTRPNINADKLDVWFKEAEAKQEKVEAIEIAKYEKEKLQDEDKVEFEEEVE